MVQFKTKRAFKNTEKGRILKDIWSVKWYHKGIDEKGKLLYLKMDLNPILRQSET